MTRQVGQPDAVGARQRPHQLRPVVAAGPDATVEQHEVRRVGGALGLDVHAGECKGHTLGSMRDRERLAGWPGGGRRFTGSHERGSGDPAAMPVTQWLDDTVQELDVAAWSLSVAGASYTLAELRALPQETVDATLDCTSEWYARQSWSGIRLDRLLDPGDARSIEVRSVTGYPVRLPVRDLGRVWLALDVGGRPLSPGHGSPARLVAPGRRGFWWVKWVASIEPSPIPWWLQSPFPLT